MKKIDYKDKGSILNPLKNLQFFARKPVTEILQPRPASASYRGFHINDLDKCIGCSSCQKICDNAAITMVEIPSIEEDASKGLRNLRPAIDYGRCCWCALCVDICPTGAIEMSREYVHTCDGDETDSYFILPQKTGIHGLTFEKGWTKTADSDLLDHNRRPMGEKLPEARIDNFDEIVDGFTLEMAVEEASRCVDCGLCEDACPAHMHAPNYIRSIYEGNLEQAVQWMYETNPFSHVCGRVCTHICETACSLGHGDSDPIAIRWLKRYAMDNVSKTKIKQIARKGKVRKKSGKSIAVVGAGPAGLTAAFDLVKKGHKVTVYESLPKAGGMTRYGIPNYRLPEDRLDQDIEVIQSVGVDINYNIKVGVDISMAQLQKDNDAVIMAIGMQNGRSTRIPGSDNKWVVKAVDLLRMIPKGDKFKVPKSAVVIGGGNVAMDIARSLARLQKQKYGKVNIILTALEQLGKTFLADDEEVIESREEGIEILDCRGPKACEIDDKGKLKGLHTVKVISIFDEQGRFAPKYDESDAQFHATEMVIEAIGQMSDVSILGDDLTEQLEWNRGRIKIDENGATSVEWLWSAGDMVKGPDVINAVADGHRVATDIDQYLQN
jgi:glutamate synthase (NADPH/NADH) small chain